MVIKEFMGLPHKSLWSVKVPDDIYVDIVGGFCDGVWENYIGWSGGFDGRLVDFMMKNVDDTLSVTISILWVVFRIYTHVNK